MAIFYDENAKTISIDTEHTTYQMKIGPYGVLLHTYYGKRISGEDMSYLFRYWFFYGDGGRGNGPNGIFGHDAAGNAFL